MRFLSLCLFVVFFVACRGIRTLPADYAVPSPKTRQVVAIFMDGTRDRLWDDKDSMKRSHVQASYLLLRDNIKGLYVEGVGAGDRWVQAAKGGSTKERIMVAYRFLTENYQPGDSICLFGFSRGANQCRILSGIIYTMGIIDLDKIRNESDKRKLLHKLYEEYIGSVSVHDKKRKLAERIDRWNAGHKDQQVRIDTNNNVTIEVMGLWDTVEALKVGDKVEDPTPLPEHLNQLYNVKKLFHALSLDDNRAFNYTPVLATHKDVLLHSSQDINEIVEEVWFNGSHKNVGGGDYETPALNSITLKWMLSRLHAYKLFKPVDLTTNIYGEVRSMRKGATRITALSDTLRGINKYWEAMNPSWNKHRIKVHASVIGRLDAGIVLDFKTQDGRPDWYDWAPFRECFIAEGRKRKFKPGCCCIEVVN